MPTLVQKIDLGRAKCGDWWEGVYNQTLTINGVPTNLTGATVHLDFKKSLKDLRAALTLSSAASGGITIGNAAVGEFTVNGRNLALEPGTYEFDCRVELDNDHIHTIWCGSIVMVQTVTEL